MIRKTGMTSSISLESVLVFGNRYNYSAAWCLIQVLSTKYNSISEIINL